MTIPQRESDQESLRGTRSLIGARVPTPGDGAMVRVPVGGNRLLLELLPPVRAACDRQGSAATAHAICARCCVSDTAGGATPGRKGLEPTGRVGRLDTQDWQARQLDAARASADAGAQAYLELTAENEVLRAILGSVLTRYALLAESTQNCDG